MSNRVVAMLLDFLLSFALNRNVSIHASTQDVTANQFRDAYMAKISIHTSTQDVTKSGKSKPKVDKLFQSTHPRRM